MIRWARRADEELGIVADSLAAWEANWLRRWRPAEREVLVLSASPLDLEERLGGLAFGPEIPGPGTRLVLTLTHRLEEEPSRSGGLLSVLDHAGWAPERPHRCDPLPGDPQATPVWREREGILIESFGARIGAVLAKKLQPADLDRTTFVALPGQLEAGYFPLPADGHLPLPDRVLRGGPFRAGDFAAAFGVRLRDAMPLIDELLASGALAVTGRRGA